MTFWQRFWCRLGGKHMGHVGFIRGSGSYWMCDNCGAVKR